MSIQPATTKIKMTITEFYMNEEKQLITVATSREQLQNIITNSFVKIPITKFVTLQNQYSGWCEVNPSTFLHVEDGFILNR
jgi:ABC-type sulfate transport system substrate-binding protein